MDEFLELLCPDDGDFVFDEEAILRSWHEFLGQILTEAQIRVTERLDESVDAEKQLGDALISMLQGIIEELGGYDDDFVEVLRYIADEEGLQRLCAIANGLGQWPGIGGDPSRVGGKFTTADRIKSLIEEAAQRIGKDDFAKKLQELNRLICILRCL